ncbi:hypothetical protein [Enterobacter cloacae]|uniref:hypothetical protein n=1 Tax=Enterobacter cloacae TaxID=550 RepID=UPI0007356161|nr:hypothetical protein [Enterobacter cloacae]KTH71094.1 hypothetical protein ASV19_17625 [Enterobacter cloacae subsp. cloacae]
MPPLKQIVLTAGRWRVTARQKKLSQKKIALHRTRLRLLGRISFSVLFFYKPDRQTVQGLTALRYTQTEKFETNFSFFSTKDLWGN